MNRKKLTVLLTIILCFIILRYYKVGDSFTVTSIIENKNELIAFAKNHYLASILIYIASYVLLVGAGLPISAVLCIVAGLIFGLFEGVILAVSSATLGSIISFIGSRYIFSDYIRKNYKYKIDIFETRVSKNRTKYIIWLRLLPGMPFFLVNILAGITSIDLFAFVWSTALGILPSTIVFILTGNALRNISDLSEFKSAQLIIPIVIIVLITLTTIVTRALYMKKKAIKTSF